MRQIPRQVPLTVLVIAIPLGCSPGGLKCCRRTSGMQPES